MRKMQSKRINGAAAARLLSAFHASPTLSFEAMTEAVAASGWALNNLLGALEQHFGLKVEGQWERGLKCKTYTVTCWGLFDFRTIPGAMRAHSIQRPARADRQMGLYLPEVDHVPKPPLGVQHNCAALPVPALGMHPAGLHASRPRGC